MVKKFKWGLTVLQLKTFKKKEDTQLDRLEVDINILKRANQNIRQTNELLTNKIDHLTLMLKHQSLMMKWYFGKKIDVDKNSILDTSNDKELIDLAEKNIITKKLTLNHLLDSAKKGSWFMNIFGEGTNSDLAKMEFNWITN